MSLKLIIMALVCLCIAHVAFARPLGYQFPTVDQEQRFAALSKQIRCEACNNQSIHDSLSPTAAQMREVVHAKLQAGESDTAILGYFRERYGDFILFSPPLRWTTLPLWFIPVAMLIMVFVWGRRQFNTSSLRGEN